MFGFADVASRGGIIRHVLEIFKHAEWKVRKRARRCLRQRIEKSGCLQKSRSDSILYWLQVLHGQDAFQFIANISATLRRSAVMRPNQTIILIFALIFVVSVPAWAHGGGLGADGCHMDKATGERHCHRQEGVADSDAPEGPGFMSLIGTGQSGSTAAAELRLAPELILSFQYLLKALGFDVGEIDSANRGRTEATLGAFQTKCGVEGPAKLDLPQLAALAKAVAEQACRAESSR